MRILVIGGSGFLGQQIIAKLAIRGDKITVPTRRLLNARELLVFPTVTVQTGDIHDDHKLNNWVRDHDVVINLVGVLHSRPGQPYGPDFERAHVTLPARLAKACVEQGVKQFIHISALGADANGPSGYQRSKAAGEAAILAACKGHDALCVTIFRPSVVFGPGDKFMNMFAQLAKFFPVLPMAGSKTRMQPIYVGDVAQAVMNALGNDHVCGQTFDLAGPHIYTLGELVSLASKWSGHER
ncbi:MAG: complex I NDUFA9 subunit family protein, partial [Burkholderiaceae bacterium]|nr:complex I NDUFA9 subunit family protein [Burkholderiaceae bacterium]